MLPLVRVFVLSYLSMLIQLQSSCETPAIAGGQLHSGDIRDCKGSLSSKLDIWDDHRSCKHPFHIPLVVWHRSKSACDGGDLYFGVGSVQSLG